MQNSINTSQVRLLGTIDVPALTSRFVARDKFVLNTETSDKPLIFEITGFEDFLSGEGKIENPRNAQTIRYSSLTSQVGDKEIVRLLGGEARLETELSIIFSLVKNQNPRKPGVLIHENNRSNIFYVRGQSGRLVTVFVHSVGIGWSFISLPFKHPARNNTGSRIFSR